MKKPFLARAADSFDAAAVRQTIERAFAAAGLDGAHSPLRGAADVVRRALASAGLGPVVPADFTSATGVRPVTEVVARVVADDEQAATGTFSAHEFSNAAGSRPYKLYVPGGVSAARRPMVVMLHGCTQSADDFAAGTRMNRLADELGFLVLYPEQTAQANPSRCWNWFKPQDQRRGGGEPAVIAGMVGDVAARHDVDPRRVFVAGLSAGAAMAVVLGEAYPELFAGVGVHSGLPYASARDVPSAMAAMKGGRSGLPGLQGALAAGAHGQLTQAVPTIVFHGDRDHTVQQANADEIVRHAVHAHRAVAGDDGLLVRSEAGVAAGGRRYSTTVHADAQGCTQVESWTLHGAGHAWSGGDAGGSYTDPAGPDASAEMMRFFLALPCAGSA